MSTSKVEKIRAEIKRRYKECKGATPATEYQELLAFIDSMQEEPISEKKCIFTKDSYTDEDRKVICKDCKEKCEYSKKEEPVSEDLPHIRHRDTLDEFAYQCAYDLSNDWAKETPTWNDVEMACKLGANWQKEHLWKPADGDDLPEYDREVIALLDNGKVVFAHRPDSKGWDAKSIITEKVEHYTPETYDKGGWNIPDVKYWLDVELPKEIEL